MLESILVSLVLAFSIVCARLCVHGPGVCVYLCQESISDSQMAGGLD